MSEITLQVNGNTLNLKEKSLRAYNAIVNTGNPGADTVVKAVKDAGGPAFVESFASNGQPTDIFRVVAVGTSKGSKVTTTGESTRAKIAKKMSLALSADEWQNVSTRVVEGKEESEDSGDEDGIEIA